MLSKYSMYEIKCTGYPEGKPKPIGFWNKKITLFSDFKVKFILLKIGIQLQTNSIIRNEITACCFLV